MKIECLKERLLEAVVGAERVTGKQLPLQILSAVIIEAIDKQIIIKSTNLDLYTEYNIPAKIEKKGIVAVPGRILTQLINHLPNQSKITLELIDSNLHIYTPETKVIIKTILFEDFPESPKISKEKPTIVIPSNVFLNGLTSVCFAAAVSDIKPEVSSVFLDNDGDDLVFTSTDTFRLAQKRIELKKGNSSVKNISNTLIPIKNVLEIIRVFENKNEDLSIWIQPHQIVFATNGIILTSRLIDGVFPDVNQIFPRKSTTEVIALKHELTQSLRIVTVFTDKFNRVGIKVMVKDKHCELYSKNQETGEGVVKLDATLEGEDVDMQFNAKYILDVFQSTHDGEA